MTPPVMLTGGVGGYLVFSLAGNLGILAGAGAFSMLTVGAVGGLRLVTGRRRNPDAATYFREQGPMYRVFQTINATAMAIVSALLLKEAGPANLGVGLSISVALLIFGCAGGG